MTETSNKNYSWWLLVLFILIGTAYTVYLELKPNVADSSQSESVPVMTIFPFSNKSIEFQNDSLGLEIAKITAVLLSNYTNEEIAISSVKWNKSDMKNYHDDMNENSDKVILKGQFEIQGDSILLKAMLTDALSGKVLWNGTSKQQYGDGANYRKVNTEFIVNGVRDFLPK